MTPYSYRPAATPLHGIPAGYKLLGLCALSLSSFFAGPPGLIIATVVMTFTAVTAKLGPAQLFSGSKPLALTTGLIVALRAVVFSGPGFALSLDSIGLAEGLLFAWGVFVAFASGAILFATTTTAELRSSLARGETAMKSFLSTVLPARLSVVSARVDISLVVALALAFIPRVFVVWESAEDAYLARGGSKGVRAVSALIPIVMERLIESAAETAHALESRGYSASGADRID